MGENEKEGPRHDSDRDPFQCYCGKQCDNDEKLQEHKNHKHEDKNWMCSGVLYDTAGNLNPCQKLCKDGPTLWSCYCHIHEGRYQHYCDVSDCTYGSDALMNIHKHHYNSHGTPAPHEAKCPKCQRVFRQSGKRDRHIVTCQTDEKPFHCDDCDKNFSQKGTYAHHMKQYHSPEGIDPAAHFF